MEKDLGKNFIYKLNHFDICLKHYKSTILQLKNKIPYKYRIYSK